jgi:hypothetical protein
MRDTYEAITREFGGKLTRAGVSGLLRSLGVLGGGGGVEGDAEPLELLWGEMGLMEGMPVGGWAREGRVCWAGFAASSRGLLTEGMGGWADLGWALDAGPVALIRV